MNRGLILMAALALMFRADLSAAQRTFVSAASGSDSNSCSRLLPCRNFAAALPHTDLDGEIIVLDSGGYGVVTITQPVSIISPDGVHAGITAFAGVAITVAAGVSDRIVLRNLQLQSQGPTFAGIDADTVHSLSVENCVVSGFDYGIRFDPTTSEARLYVGGTTVRRTNNGGVWVSGATGTRVALNGVRLQENNTGAYFTGAEVVIRDTVTSGAASPGFWAAANAKVTIEDSFSSDHAVGFIATGNAKMIVTRCAATANGTGVQSADAGSTVYVSDSTITGNGTGVVASAGGLVTSRGNNTLQANLTNGTFGAGFPED